MDDFTRFRQMVFEDSHLRDQLLAESQLEPFLQLVVRLAAGRGLSLTEEHVREEHRQASRAWIERQIR
jgi:hypothetical protein